MTYAPIRLLRRSRPRKYREDGLRTPLRFTPKPQTVAKHHLPLVRCALMSGLMVTEAVCGKRWGIAHGRSLATHGSKLDHAQIKDSACSGVCEDGRRRWEQR